MGGIPGGAVIARLIPCFLIAAVVAQAPAHSTATGEWPTYGGDLANSKYSPLDQVNASNFGSLRIAWRARSPDGFLSLTLPNGTEWSADAKTIFDELNRLDPKRWREGQPPFVQNFKATPLMVGGTVYVNTPLSVGAAYDARTGALKWVYNPKSYEAGTTTMSLRWNQRGVAYWSDGSDERIYWGTGDGYLVAVDARTGRPIPGFGTNGRVDLMDGLPRAKRGTRDYLNALTYSVQSPPIVVRDVVITPAAISSLITTKEQIPGWIRAFDARTGQVRWTFRTVPAKGEFGSETWGDGANEYAGKVTVWTLMSADEALGHVYLPTNTTAPDFYGAHRLGDNLFAESIVALDVRTGQRVWHFQTVHHGLWDYDNPAAPNLLDITVNGAPIKALAQITKQGYIYTFDRVTGKPVWPIEEKPVGPSDVPGEKASPTQPIPSKPTPFEYQGASVEDLADFTPEIRAMAVKAIEGFKYGPLFTPPSLQGTISRPGSTGGANWSGAALDPATGMLYVPSRNGYSVLRLNTPEAAIDSNLLYMQAPARNPQMPEGLPLFKPPYSRITAIDMNTGNHVWMVPAGRGERIRNIARLKGLNLPPLGGDSTFSGPLLTKTVLIYALTTGGTTGGPRLVAYNKATGNELASVDLPGPAIGTPMTYAVGGRQFVAITVQGRTATDIPELIALSLPSESSQVPAAPQVQVRVQTEMGDIVIEVDPARAPVTATNFLKYVDAGHFDGGVFHRTVRTDNQPESAIKIEVIQAGVNPARGKAGFPAIPLERTSITGILHQDAVVSMARGGPDTATSGWFICINDQPSLDFGGMRNPDGQGFGAFGRVLSGMDVVRRIQGSPASANRSTNAEAQRLTPPIKIVRVARITR